MSRAQARPVLRIGKRPGADTRLPYLLSLPVEGEERLVLATRELWPSGRDLYCHQLSEWPEEAELVEDVPVLRCVRKGASIQLLLDRRTRRRSLFVWTTSKKGRPLIFWRTPETTRNARPSWRVPKATGEIPVVTISVDTRERYPWTFKRAGVSTERRDLPCGDYGIMDGGGLVAAVERKRPSDLAHALVSGQLHFTLQDLSRLPHAVLIIEGRYSDLGKEHRVRAGWLYHLMTTLQVAYPKVGWVFAETRQQAEDYAYRWLAAVMRATGGFETQRGERPVPVRDRAHRREEALAAAKSGTVWTRRAYGEYFRVSDATAYADLKRLVAEGALVEEGDRRSRVYAYTGVR